MPHVSRVIIAACTSIALVVSPASANTQAEPPRKDSRLIREAGFGVAVEFGPCTLYPSVIHPRTSRPGYIGPKPYTKCKVNVDSISQDTELYYEWYAWWKSAVKASRGNRGERTFTQRNVEFKCRGTQDTVWAGTTAGTVVYQGRTYYARVWQKQVRVPCGA